MKAFTTVGGLELGLVVITVGANAQLSPDDILVALARHRSSDWGDLDEFEWKQNDDAREYGGRLLSKYHSRRDTQFWIITESDRSVTTIFLPAEH